MTPGEILPLSWAVAAGLGLVGLLVVEIPAKVGTEIHPPECKPDNVKFRGGVTFSRTADEPDSFFSTTDCWAWKTKTTLFLNTEANTGSMSKDDEHTGTRCCEATDGPTCDCVVKSGVKSTNGIAHVSDSFKLSN